MIQYNQKEKEKEIKKMAKNKTRGWYTFADGYEVWVNGYSAAEKRNEIRKHGAIIRFIPTN